MFREMCEKGIKWTVYTKLNVTIKCAIKFNKKEQNNKCCKKKYFTMKLIRMTSTVCIVLTPINFVLL